MSDSGKAILFYDGFKDVWIPYSQIENDRDDLVEGCELNLLIPEWLAKEKGLI